MTTIRIYEPALCCSTGVCGEDVDQNLVTFTADLGFIKTLGADAERVNLANDPVAFTRDAEVLRFLNVAGSEGLPLTRVDGVTVATGRYPTRDQLLGYAGLGERQGAVAASDSASRCCGSSSSCS